MKTKHKTSGKMQDVSFSDVEDLLEFLPLQEKKMMIALRKLIMECIPGIKEKLTYNAPFYRLHSSVCFLWPGSLPWGKKTYPGRVKLGFAKGHLLTDEEKKLVRENRKYVSYLEFNSLSEIDFPLVKQYLYEAALINQSSVRKKT